MKYTPSSRDALDAHCREVIRSCLNIVEQHGDTYVAIHKDDEIDCVVLVSMIRSYLDDDGDSEICPCAFVMLMSDGKIEPFVFATDKDIERIANKGHTGFTGFVPTK